MSFEPVSKGTLSLYQKDKLIEEIHRAYAEIERLASIHHTVVKSTIEWDNINERHLKNVTEENFDLRFKVNRMREALEFYAYGRRSIRRPPGMTHEWEISNDKGERARKALESIQE